MKEDVIKTIKIENSFLNLTCQDNITVYENFFNENNQLIHTISTDREEDSVITEYQRDERGFLINIISYKTTMEERSKTNISVKAKFEFDDKERLLLFMKKDYKEIYNYNDKKDYKEHTVIEETSYGIKEIYIKKKISNDKLIKFIVKINGNEVNSFIDIIINEDIQLYKVNICNRLDNNRNRCEYNNYYQYEMKKDKIVKLSEIISFVEKNGTKVIKELDQFIYNKYNDLVLERYKVTRSDDPDNVYYEGRKYKYYGDKLKQILDSETGEELMFYYRYNHHITVARCFLHKQQSLLLSGELVSAEKYSYDITKESKQYNYKAHIIGDEITYTIEAKDNIKDNLLIKATVIDKLNIIAFRVRIKDVKYEIKVQSNPTLGNYFYRYNLEIKYFDKNNNEIHIYEINTRNRELYDVFLKEVFLPKYQRLCEVFEREIKEAINKY